MRDDQATCISRLGRELTPDAEQKMRDFLAAHPGDGGGGRYTWADTGLDAGEVREQVRAYQDRYGGADRAAAIAEGPWRPRSSGNQISSGVPCPGICVQF